MTSIVFLSLNLSGLFETREIMRDTILKLYRDGIISYEEYASFGYQVSFINRNIFRAFFVVFTVIAISATSLYFIISTTIKIFKPNRYEKN